MNVLSKYYLLYNPTTNDVHHGIRRYKATCKPKPVLYVSESDALKARSILWPKLKGYTPTPIKLERL